MISLFILCALIGVAAALFVFRSFAASASARVRGLSLVGVGLFALATLGAYLLNGQPNLPGEPYERRMAEIRQIDPLLLSPEEQEERLRDEVRRDPDNAEANAFLGRYLARTGREVEAISFLETALRLAPNARVFSDLGQALVVLNEGQITPEAERAFRSASELDETMAEPAFFLGAAAYERGDRSEAAQIWSDILVRLDGDNPARDAIAARAADLLSRPRVGPVSSEGEAPFAAAMADGASAEDMISGMIAGLADSVAADPSDLSGWLILARARLMRGDVVAARETIDAAKRAFNSNEGALILVQSIDDVIAMREAEDVTEQGSDQESEG